MLMLGIVVARLSVLGDLDIVDEGFVKLLKPIGELVSRRDDSVLIRG